MSECYRCHQRGHFARECPRGEVFSSGFPRGRGGRGMSNGFPGRGAQCYRCNDYGHFARECPQGSNEVFSGDGCFICGQAGHFARKCPQGDSNRGFRGGGRSGFRQDGGREGCFNCGRPGHFARDCRVRGGSECYSCGKDGHYSRDCPDGRWRSGNGGVKANEDKKCYKCGNLGHISRDCPAPNKRQTSDEAEEVENGTEKEEVDEAGLNFKCEKCEEPGHTASTCEKETEEPSLA